MQIFSLRFWVLVSCLFLAGFSLFASVEVRLFLNAGNIVAVDSSQYPGYAFNETPNFVPQNAVVEANTGDTLIFIVTNTDTLLHGFAVKGISSTPLGPLDSLRDTIVFNTPGLFIYHDDSSYPTYTYLGAAGMIYISDPNTFGTFYWNFKEHEDAFNVALANGQSVSWNGYTPNYFTVNGRGKPDIPNDASAVVTGNVGDTIRILMVNTGRSVHSLHFHGYHCEIIYASQDNRWVGASKDSFPLKSMETMILQLVPDKPGQYPVHDHNLIAVSGGGIYPNGIFMMMYIN